MHTSHARKYKKCTVQNYQVMSVNTAHSTPINKDKKKRTLSSPVHLLDSKKSKPTMAHTSTEKMILEEEISECPESLSVIHPSESMVESSRESMAGLLPVANITLTDENIVQITTIVKDSLNVELPLMVSSIITGVLEGLQSKVASLEVENSQLRFRVDLLESKVDKTEQYSPRNCLRLSGINETDAKSIDNKVMEIANALGADISLEEIDRSHRLGKQKDSGRPWDIIIKFTSYRSCTVSHTANPGTLLGFLL